VEKLWKAVPMTRSEQINELAAALALAQGEIAHAKKESENPHFKHRYADLASIWDACRVALTKRGLSIVQSPRLIAGGDLWLVEVETTLLHQSGQSLSDILAVPVNPASAQAVGSAITYARRYALASFVGVAPEDDDMTAGSGARPARTRDVAADRPPAPPADPAPIETAIVHVLGIVKRPSKSGADVFILTGDDQRTYQTHQAGVAQAAKAAKEAQRAIEIESRATAAGRVIVRLRSIEDLAAHPQEGTTP
jgi:ERF superfamily